MQYDEAELLLDGARQAKAELVATLNKALSR